MTPAGTEIETLINGISVKLIFNEEIILPTRNSDFSIKFSEESLSGWQFIFKFLDQNLDNTPFQSTITYNGKQIIATYYNWNTLDASAVENINPYHIKSDNDSISLFYKIRTSANLDKDMRVVHICLWKVK